MDGLKHGGIDALRIQIVERTLRNTLLEQEKCGKILDTRESPEIPHVAGGREVDAMRQGLTPGWRASPAHMFLLGRFLEPKRVEELTTSVNWALTLGEKPETVVEQLLAAGLLEYADGDEPLASRLDVFKVQELREMLRERNLPIYGRKDELISRLIRANAEAMEEAVRAVSALRCSEQGRLAVEAFLLRKGAAAEEEIEQPTPGLKDRLGRPFGWLASRLGGDEGPADLDTPPAMADVPRPSESEIRSAEEHLQRGRTYGSQKDLDQALVEFDIAIKLNPLSAPAHFWRGVTYEHQGQYQRALADFRQALRLDPQHARSYVGRGDAYRGLGDSWLAIQEYDVALRLDPNLAVAYHNRGVAYECLGDYRRALADYDKAIALRPDAAEPHFGRGMIYAQAGSRARAAAEFEMVLRLSEDAEIVAQARERLESVQTPV
jgi:tetratricopeptide (TPR) repeat protein